MESTKCSQTSATTFRATARSMENSVFLSIVVITQSFSLVVFASVYDE